MLLSWAYLIRSSPELNGSGAASVHYGDRVGYLSVFPFQEDLLITIPVSSEV
jgi:hypothetical protein